MKQNREAAEEDEAWAQRAFFSSAETLTPSLQSAWVGSAADVAVGAC